MAALTPEEREALHRIHLIFGQSASDTQEFLKSLYIYAMFQHADKKPVVIPYLGTLSIEYVGEETSRAGRRAKLDASFVPSNSLSLGIGQQVDGDTTEADRFLIARIRDEFKAIEG